MEEVQQFDWADKGSIVVRRVDAIAIYKNSDGDIVIRQQRVDVPVDAVVTIPAQHAYSVIEGIQRQVKGPFIAPLGATGGG
jgi:NADH/NAD ratio-sensing transcriptional regulator Rex